MCPWSGAGLLLIILFGICKSLFLLFCSCGFGGRKAAKRAVVPRRHAIWSRVW